VSEDASVERLSVGKAAQVLGVTRDAIHKRINRGSIEFERGDDGRLYVYVDTSTLGLDSSTDTSKGESKVESNVESNALISEMRGRIEDLRMQLEAETRANEENRRIIAALTSRIPELPPASSQEPRESPESEASPGPSTTTPTEEAGGAQEPTERPWWRRMFGT
jgi:hypothetical protein